VCIRKEHCRVESDPHQQVDSVPSLVLFSRPLDSRSEMQGDSLQSNFGPYQIRFPPVKLSVRANPATPVKLFWSGQNLVPSSQILAVFNFNRPVPTISHPTISHEMSQNVTEMSRECHGMSRECHGMSRECHGMSRNVTRMSRECHGMSRNVTTPSPRVSVSLEASQSRQRVDAVTWTGHAGGL
jgi:hypothetical protein